MPHLPFAGRNRRFVPVAAIMTIFAALTAYALFHPRASSLAVSSPDPLLTRLSALTTHGWLHDRRPFRALERRFAEGRRAYVTCGTLARLAQRLLATEGIPSRVVTTLSRRRFNGSDDGHTMIEVRTHEGWALFDLSTNRVAVDREGNRIGFLAQMRAGSHRRWKLLSNDKLIDFRGTLPETRVASALYLRSLPSWYQRVLGTPLIETAPNSNEYVFRDPVERRRVESYSPAYRWASKPEWRALTED